MFGLLKPGGGEGLGSEAVQGVSGICPLDPLLPGPASLVHPLLQGCPPTSTSHLHLPFSFPTSKSNNERGILIGLTYAYHLCLGRIPGLRTTCYRQMIGYLCCQVPTQAQSAGLKGCNRTRMSGAKNGKSCSSRQNLLQSCVPQKELGFRGTDISVSFTERKYCTCVQLD